MHACVATTGDELTDDDMHMRDREASRRRRRRFIVQMSNKEKLASMKRMTDCCIYIYRLQ